MDLLKWLFWIGCVAALGYAYLAAVTRTNRYCEQRFGYRPISFATVTLATIPFAIVLAGILTVGSDITNWYVGIGIAVLIFTGLMWYIASKTELGVAIGATVLLAIAGLGVFILLLIVLLMLNSNSRPEEKRTS